MRFSVQHAGTFGALWGVFDGDVPGAQVPVKTFGEFHNDHGFFDALDAARDYAAMLNGTGPRAEQARRECGL